MLPPRRFVPGYVARGVILWFAVHLGAAAVEIPFVLPLLIVPLVPVVVFTAALVDDRARREGPLLGNLGVPPWAASLVSAGAALAVEVALQVGGRLA